MLIVMAGSAAVTTRLIFHPRTYPTTKPPKHMNVVITYVATFSPMAPWIENDSAATFVASSLGFIESNQPISCFRIALKYSLRKRIACFSPVIIQQDICTQEATKEHAPRITK